MLRDGGESRRASRQQMPGSQPNERQRAAARTCELTASHTPERQRNESRKPEGHSATQAQANLRVDVGTVVDEELDHGEVPLGRRQVQRRALRGKQTAKESKSADRERRLGRRLRAAQPSRARQPASTWAGVASGKQRTHGAIHQQGECRGEHGQHVAEEGMRKAGERAKGRN